MFEPYWRQNNGGIKEKNPPKTSGACETPAPLPPCRHRWAKLTGMDLRCWFEMCCFSYLMTSIASYRAQYKCCYMHASTDGGNGSRGKKCQRRQYFKVTFIFILDYFVQLIIYKMSWNCKTNASNVTFLFLYYIYFLLYCLSKCIPVIQNRKTWNHQIRELSWHHTMLGIFAC